MRIMRVYTGSDQRSYFEDLEAPERVVTGSHMSMDDSLPVLGGRFSSVSAGKAIERHTAPRRQFLIFLAGRVEIECAGGSRTAGPGDVVLADDLTGEGHITRILEDVKSFVVPLDETYDLTSWRKDGA
jgi:hypothetical protein